MYNDAYNILKLLYEKYGQGKFPREEIQLVMQEKVVAVQWLIDNGYLFAHEFISSAYITPTGIQAYLNETLSRKDQFEHQKQEEARKNAERLSDRAYADKQTQKHFRHDWWIHIFDAVVGFVLGIIADYFFDIVGNAIRLWRFLSEWLQTLSPP